MIFVREERAANAKPEQRDAAPVDPKSEPVSNREGAHEVRTYRGLDYIVLEGDRGGQIRLDNFCNFRIHLALITLCIAPLRPESDGDGLLGRRFGHER